MNIYSYIKKILTPIKEPDFYKNSLLFCNKELYRITNIIRTNN